MGRKIGWSHGWDDEAERVDVGGKEWFDFIEFEVKEREQVKGWEDMVPGVKNEFIRSRKDRVCKSIGN